MFFNFTILIMFYFIIDFTVQLFFAHPAAASVHRGFSSSAAPALYLHRPCVASGTRVSRNEVHSSTGGKLTFVQAYPWWRILSHECCTCASSGQLLRSSWAGLGWYLPWFRHRCSRCLRLPKRDWPRRRCALLLAVERLGRHLGPRRILGEIVLNV